jgi:hypothetical protein
MDWEFEILPTVEACSGSVDLMMVVAHTPQIRASQV